MSNTAIVIPEEMEQYELPDDEGTISFTGRFLDTVDNDGTDARGKPRQRWVELQAWEYIDTNPGHDSSLPFGDPDRDMYGKRVLLLYAIGHSVLYHAPDGCSKGVITAVRDFPAGEDEMRDWNAEAPEDLEPCPVCHPGKWQLADPDDEFKVEVYWYSPVVCQTPAAFIEALHRPERCRRCKHDPHRERGCWCRCVTYTEDPPALSIPGGRLARQLARKDPEIAEALKKNKVL